MPAPRPPPRALFTLLVVQLLFGTLGPVGKVAMPVFGASGIALARIAGGALVFGALRALFSLPRVPREHQLRLALCAVVGIAGNQLLFLAGLSRTSSIHATLIVTTTPVFTMLLAALIDGERPTPRTIGGVALSLSGVALLLSPGLGGGSLVGDLLVLANTALYSLYLVCSRPLLKALPPLSVAAGLFAWGVPWVLLASALTGAAPSLGGLAGFAVPPAAGWALAWIVLGPTVGTYLLNLVALRSVPATLVGLFIALQPFVAAAIAIPLLGEEPGLREVAAACLSVAGIALASLRR